MAAAIHTTHINTFTNNTMKQQESHLGKALDTLAEKIKSDEERRRFKQEIDGFILLFAQYRSVKGKTIEWEKIRPPSEKMLTKYSDLGECPKDRMKSLAAKLTVLKLNGGLGTTMGCTGPKSVIEVHSDQSFLDCTVQQIKELNTDLNSDVPLILMNSFNTHDDTLKVVSKYAALEKCKVLNFNQSRYPRVLKDSLLPFADDPNGNIEHWYPPGHGDVYQAFANSGLLDELLKAGKEYVFISNIDNLGATVDFNILNYMDNTKVDFIMELTDKTRSDVKGGTLIEYEGNPKLFEIAQCPSSKLDEFKSIKKFKVFNTNNLWVSLRAIKKLVDEKKMREADVIVNPKKVLGKDVIQLEIAAGAAIQFFENAKGVNVPRSRFLPVKSTSDLFVVQSDLYVLQKGTLNMNSKRAYNSLPLVNLGDTFKKVSDYNARIKSPPDIVELDQLTISGDVYLGAGVSLRGTVIIVANQGSRIDIPDGSILENKVVSGNLRILDH